MPTLGSSRDCLHLIGFGKTNTSLCVVTIGRGFHKKTLGILLESVGRGGPLRRLVCVFLLVLFLVFGSSSLPDLSLFCRFAVLDRPLLNSVWQQRILKILDIEDRRYNIFIEPDLFASFSLGPVPSSTVKDLIRANKKRELLCQCLSMNIYKYLFFFFFNFRSSLVCRCEYDETEQE